MPIPSPCLSPTHHRFLWRHKDKQRWYSVTLAEACLQKALASFKRHLLNKAKLSFDAVVVDHSVNALSMAHGRATVSPVSILSIDRELHLEFRNKVWPPGIRPDH